MMRGLLRPAACAVGLRLRHSADVRNFRASLHVEQPHGHCTWEFLKRLPVQSSNGTAILSLRSHCILRAALPGEPPQGTAQKLQNQLPQPYQCQLLLRRSFTVAPEWVGFRVARKAVTFGPVLCLRATLSSFSGAGRAANVAKFPF